MKLFTLSSGRWSKSKITAVLTALFGLVTALGVVELTPEQVSGIIAGAMGLIGLFIRDGIDSPE